MRRRLTVHPTLSQGLALLAAAGFLAFVPQGRGAAAAPAPAPAPSNSGVAPASSAPPVAPPAAALPPLLPRLPPETRVLHIGDSFAGALGRDLNDALRAHQVEGTVKFKRSTYIPTWASSEELPTYLRRYKPDLVVITLGANELQIPEPTDRVRTIRKLVSRLQGRPCVWIGVPLWPGARGDLLQVIEDNVAPCRYLDSNRLFPEMPRARDGIHPSIAARAEWADRVVHWLQAHVDPRAASVGEWRFLTKADPTAP